MTNMKNKVITNNFNITCLISGDENVISKSAVQKIGDSMKKSIIDTIARESRPGGLLAPTFKK